MEHSIISPSSMARISKCPASVPMQRAIPEDDTPHETRDVGTAVHWVNEVSLRGTPVSPGATCPDNGIIITQEMFNRGRVYVDLCRSIHGQNHIEERIECKRVHPECFGTADFWSYNPEINHITMVDYKDGYIDVSPVENPQLITYDSGIIDLVDGLEINMTVENIIVQPRSGGIKRWSCKATDLRGFINQYSYAAHQALGDNPEAVAGEHCKYCSARAVCKSLGTTVQNLVHIADNTPAEPNLAQEYEFLKFAEKLIKARLTGIEAVCMKTPPPGYEIGTGRGRKAWSVDTSVIRDTSMLYGLDLMKEPAPITPIQAITAGMPKEVIDGMSNFYAGKPTLKKVDMEALQLLFKPKEN